MFSFPTIHPPASKIRSTTTASALGVYDAVADAFVVGTPATSMLSLIPTDLPASGPSVFPRTSQSVVKTLNGSSLGAGRPPTDREVKRDAGGARPGSAMIWSIVGSRLDTEGSSSSASLREPSSQSREASSTISGAVG